MKKLALLIFVALVSAMAVAQGPGGRGGPGGGQRDPKARFEKMKKDLNLTPAQATKVEALQTKMRADMKKLRDSKADPKTMGPQFKKVFDTYGAGMKKILNKDQQAKFDAMMKARMGRMGGGMGRRPGGPGGPGGPPKKGGGA